MRELHHTNLFALVVLTTSVLASCFGFDIPDDAQIACDAETKDACPPGYVCREAIGLCVETEGLDDQAPGIDGEIEVTPRYGNRASTFRVSFTVTEPLEIEPQVIAKPTVGAVAFSLDETQSDSGALRYSFVHAVSDDDVAGEWQVSISLLDRSGNPAAISAGLVVLDFGAPAISDVDLTPRIASAGVEVTLSLVFSEPLGASPTVSMQPSAGAGTPIAWAHASSADALSHTFTFTPAGSEVEGEHMLEVQAEDSSGNPATVELLETLVLDFQPVSLVTQTVEPELARPGQVVLVSLSLSEAPDGIPALRGEAASGTSISFNLSTLDGPNVSFAHAAQPGEDGAYTLVLAALLDAAGNQTASQSVGHITIDGTAPALVDFTPDTHLSLLASDTLEVNFRSDEPLSQEPEVSFGGHTLTRDASTGADPYRFTLPLAGTDLQGTLPIEVQLVDLAGNRAFHAPVFASVDSAPPLLVDAFFSPEVARLGVTALLTVTTNEPLAASPTLSWAPAGGDPGFIWSELSGLSHNYALEVDTSVTPGSYTLMTVELEDSAGNATTVDVTQSLQLTLDLEVDNRPPEFASVSTSSARYSSQTGFHEVLVYADVSEPLDTTPAALSVDLAGTQLSCGTYQSASPNYTCAHVIAGAVPEGASTIRLNATDAAGNAGFDSVGVVIDYTPPSLAASSITPGAAKAGDTVTILVSSDEPLGAGATLTVRHRDLAGVTLDFAETAPGIFEHPVTVADDDGSYDVSVDLVDQVGNGTLGAIVGSFDLDGSAPLITNIDTGGGVFSDESGHNQLQIAFDCPEDVTIDGTLVVTVDGLDISADCVYASGGYSCTRQVLGTEGEGLKSIAITATDAAGNGGFGSTYVIYDFTGPEVVAGTDSLVLLPDATNPILDPSAATLGTTVLVTFALSEPAAADPLVETPTTPALSFNKATGTGTLFSFQYTLAAGPAFDELNPYSVEVIALDAVGNSATSTLVHTFDADVTAPAAPDVTTAGRVVYTRSPWGRSVSGGVPRYTLEGAARAVEADSTVIVYDVADLAIASELGRGVADAGGGFGAGGSLELLRADRSTVFAAAADNAGNISAAVEVKDVTWIATQIGKVTGSTLENPHRFLVAPLAEPTLEQDRALAGEPSGADLARLTAIGDTALRTYSEQRWVERRVSQVPDPRTLFGAAYDDDRGRLVFFGGLRDDGEVLGDTWEWDLRSGRWHAVTPVGDSPDPRLGHTMVYDSGRRRVVLFGGGSDEVWEWNGVRAEWSNVTPAVAGPSARAFAALAYDRHRRRVVLFGGREGATTLKQDTWEWDGDSRSWSDVSPASGSPDPRHEHAMAYDAARRKVVLYGGGMSATVANDNSTETFEWDGTLQQWQLRTDGDAQPFALRGHAMAYDSTRQRVILFGGSAAPTPQNSFWEWDGTASDWTRIDPAGALPPARVRPALVYCPALAAAVVFGGQTGVSSSAAAADAWRLDRAGAPRWHEMSASALTPAARSHHAATYDSDRQRMIVFGGNWAALQDTWEWDLVSASWQEISPGGSPDPREGHAVAYDPINEKVLLFGGGIDIGNQGDACPADAGTATAGWLGYCSYDDTWEYDGATATWSEVTGLATAPGARRDPAMIYDASREKIWLFGGQDAHGDCGGGGGYYCNDLWSWDVNTREWQPESPAGGTPGARFGHALAYDSNRSAVVMFGGYGSGYFQDTWTLGGGTLTWSNRTLGGLKPAGRRYHAVAFDRLRDRMVLYGGYDQTNNCNPAASTCEDSWEWNPIDGTWSERAPSEFPSSRDQLSLVVDPLGDKILLFGGRHQGSSLQDDVWEWIGGASDTAAHLWEVSWDSAGAGGATIQGLTLSAYSGATGYRLGATPTEVRGVDLYGWSGVEASWIPLAANGADAGNPALLEFPSSDSAQIEELLVGDPPNFVFALVPAQVNGSNALLGSLSTDYLEIAVSYRRP